MVEASEFCLEGQIFCSLAALSHPTGLYHCEDLALTWKYSNALSNDLIQWKHNEPWLSACVTQELGFGLMPVHFFTSSDIGNLISSWEIKKKNQLSSLPFYPSLLFSQLSSLFTVWVSANIYLQVQLTAVFAGIDCLRVYLGIELPSSFRNTPLLSSAVSLPGPVFLSWVFSIFSWILSSSGGRLVPCFVPGCERCWISSTKGCSRVSLAGKENPPALIKHLLLGEPAGWISWGHRAGEVWCACLQLTGFTSWGCVWRQTWEKVLFSAAASCCGPSPGWTRAHWTIPQHPGCLPAPDARSMSPFPLPLREEFCGVSFTTTQSSCVSHSSGAARPDPDQGLQMLLQ